MFTMAKHVNTRRPREDPGWKKRPLTIAQKHTSMWSLMKTNRMGLRLPACPQDTPFIKAEGRGHL